MATFRLTFKSQVKAALAADARTTPDAVRVRSLLKFALRSLGFRCTRVEQIDAAAAPELQNNANKKRGAGTLKQHLATKKSAKGQERTGRN